MLVIVDVLSAMEVGARGARLPRERRRRGVESSLRLSLPLSLLPLPLPLMLPPAALAAVPLRLRSLLPAALFLLAALFLTAALAALAIPTSSSSPSGVAVGVLLGVARARLPASDRRRHEVDGALGVDGDEERPAAPGLEGDACFFLYVFVFWRRKDEREEREEERGE